MSRLRRRLEPSTRGAVLFILAILLLAQGRVWATNDENHIQEFLAGANGNSKIQFIVIKQEGGGNCWGPQTAGHPCFFGVAETQSRVMLVFFDALGRETGKFKFPNDPEDNNNQTLIATQEFANLPGAPTPKFIMPPLLNPISGKVCFTNNPQNFNAFPRNDCVSYGTFTGTTGTSEAGLAFGPPTAALPIVNTVSLKRNPATLNTFGSVASSNYIVNNSPTPINNAGATFTIGVSSQVTQGENLFTLETFGGNGRSCATCHVAGQSFRLPPSNIQSRFAGVAATFDPLFVGELSPSAFDAGFDFNVNTLTLTAAVASNTPCPGDFRGIITTPNGGRANVLARVSPTVYLVQGGGNPVLTGTVSDTHSCSATVSTLAAGDLARTEASGVNGLESPRRMRTSTAASFPQGRGLILENIDGIGPPLTAPVFRKSPQLLNLSRTAPFGFSGDIPDLQAFLRGAVIQHYPRTLTRSSTNSNPDFRMPTAAELQAAEAFMLAQEFPSGTDPNKFDLDRFATTAAEKRGRALFFGTAKCSQCHGGAVLAATTVSILGKPVGSNERFNTGVVNLPINGPAADNLPAEAGGAREFSVPQLFNVKNLTPLFHDASAPDVATAVEFYTGPQFNNSPSGTAIGGIALNAGEKADIVAFLDGLALRPYTLSVSTVRFGSQASGTASAAQSITITNTSTDPITFGSPACSVTGTDVTQFVVTSCPLTTPLAAGEARTIQVTFNPSSDGAKSAILEINAPDASGANLFGTGGALGVAPTVTSIAPAVGSTGGGTAVTIAGTGFVTGATVTIGGVDAGSVVVNATTITATTGAHAAGAANVVVTNPDTQTVTLINGFLFVAGPIATSLSPASGPTAGGTRVTITGANFAVGATVTIGGVAPTNIVVVNATTITATTGAHAAGTVDVVVTNTDTQTGTLTNGYTYVTRTVTAIAPTSGRTAGGTSVTITGTNFVTGTTVAIGGVAATNVSVVNATTITATTGAHAAGTVNVVVTFPDTQTGTLTNGYTYADRTVTSIAPASGRTSGGTTVTIMGTNIVAGTTVTIGGAAATSVSAVNATTLTAVTPAHAAGAVNVVVTFPDGQSGTLTNGYEYIDRTVTAIAPTSGQTAGGTSVTITGTNIVAGTTVTIGGMAATGVSVMNATTLTAMTGAHAAGMADVVVMFPDGQTGTLANGYTYADRTVTAIAPMSGTIAGGTSVTITGMNLVAGTTVTIGGVAATGVSVVNATTITAMTGAHAAGLVDVVLAFPDGQSTMLANGYRYLGPAPTVTSIAPMSGPTAGGTMVTISGTNFAAGATVAMGGATAMTVVVVNATTITATTAAHAAGTVNVVVTNADTQVATLMNGYTYNVPPVPLSITPAFGLIAGGTSLTIGGTGFMTGATVTIGGVAATSVNVVNAMMITAVAAAHAKGVVSIVVMNPDGQSGTLSSGFSFSNGNAPTVLNVTPSSDVTTGGASLTITGTDFLVSAMVSIGGTNATNIVVVTDTTITATTAAHGAGTFDVVVTNPDTQTGMLTNAFTYVDATAAPGPSGGPAPSPTPPPSTPPPSTPPPSTPPPTPSSPVPGAPLNLSGSVSGSTVSLAWTAPTSGGQPVTYVIEAGSFSGGADLTVAPTGSIATSFTADDVPSGTYFVRVRARNNAGLGEPSNEVKLTVSGGGPPSPPPPPTAAPGQPTGLVATVNGTTVVFAWSAPTRAQGGSPTTYQIEAGSSPGLSNLAVFSTGSTATSLSVGSVPAGTYYVRVRAVNAGGASAPSNEALVVVTNGGPAPGGPAPPCNAPPTPPSGLTVAVNGSTVTLGWNASAGATSYRLEVGSVPGASDLLVTDTGDGNTRLVATNVGRGTYFVRVSGVSSCGRSGPSNEVAVVVP